MMPDLLFCDKYTLVTLVTLYKAATPAKTAAPSNPHPMLSIDAPLPSPVAEADADADADAVPLVAAPAVSEVVDVADPEAELELEWSSWLLVDSLA